MKSPANSWNTHRLLRRTLVFLTLTSGIQLTAKPLYNSDKDGFKFIFGMNIASPRWSPYHTIFTEYSEVTPKLIQAPEPRKNYFGSEIGFWVSNEGSLIKLALGGINNSFTRIDSLEESLTYQIKNRYLDVSLGGNLVNEEKFRFAVLAGLNLNLLQLRSSDKSVAEQWVGRVITTMIMPFSVLTNKSPWDHEKTRFWLGGHLGALMSFGAESEFTFEYTYHLPFHRVNLNKVRDKVTPEYLQTYSDNDFKLYPRYGVFKIYFAFGNN
ncbi:MAG: hypothetical protein EP332_08740 [Bacteroidetes bacterium]|nr:MAG: hypothetical protein EP332_08740 [Bacteroidota bacterium]